MINEDKLRDFIDKAIVKKLYKSVRGGSDPEETITNLAELDDLVVMPSGLFNYYLKKYFDHDGITYFVFYPLILASKSDTMKLLYKYKRDLGDYKLAQRSKGIYYFTYIENVFKEELGDPEIFELGI